MAPFVGDERRRTVELLQHLYDEVLADSTPRMACLVAEGGWGKTRIVQEFYGWLQRERQPKGEYWPPNLSDQVQDPMRSRKVIYPESVSAPPDRGLPWLWWGLRCEQTSSGQKVRALLNDGVQLKAHLAGLVEIAERRKDNRDLALSVLGETMAFLPGVGQIASIANAAHSLAPRAWKKVIEAFQSGQSRRRAEQEPRTVDLGATSAPEVNSLVELVKQFISPELPLVLAIDDAHLADPDTVEFVRRVLTLKAPILIVCTAWPSTLDEQTDEEREIEGSQRRTYGGLLWALSSEAPQATIRHDLSPLPDEALAELVWAAAPRTDEEHMQALLESSGGNPLVLRLNLTSPRVQRSISDRAITLPPEDLRKLPRAFGRIISERFEELPEADALWLVQAALQGFEFLPGYIVAPADGLDMERINDFVRLPDEDQGDPGRFAEPAVHRAILDEADALMSSDERREWARATMEALQKRPMDSPMEEEGGRIWCKLLFDLAEEEADSDVPQSELVSSAAYHLSFIERDLGLHKAELAAAEASVRWAEGDPDDAIRALRAARWAAALLANNEPEQAVRRAEEALALIESVESPSGDDWGTVMYVLAKAHLQNQNPEAARSVALRARDLAEDPQDRIIALEVAAEADLELSDAEGAHKALTEALEIAEELDPRAPEAVLNLETELIRMTPYSGATELWANHLSKIEAELGTDHVLYSNCLTQLIYHHLLDGDLNEAKSKLPELRKLPGYEPDTVLEAVSEVLSGSDMSSLQSAFRKLVQAPYSSRSETTLFSQIGAAIGAGGFTTESLDGPYDFVRRASLDVSSAFEWLLAQIREDSADWDDEEKLFAVQTGLAYLSEHLLNKGTLHPVSAELVPELRRIGKDQPTLSRQALDSYANAMAIFKGEEVGQVDERMPPLLQSRAHAMRAVAYFARDDEESATRALEKAASLMAETKTWPSRKVILAAAERCSSPLCAKGWMEVQDFEFGSDAERREAHAGLGAWLYRQKRYAQAAEIERQVLEESIRVNGPRHSDTSAARASLGMTLLESGELEEARDLHREVVNDREEMFGAEHPQTAEATRRLVRTMIGLEEFEAALPIQEALSKESSKVNDDELLATILEGMGNPEAAKPRRERALEQWIEEAGEDDDRTLLTLSRSVENLRMCKAPKEAYPLALRLVEARLRTDGPDASATRTAKLLLAAVCAEDGDLQEAARLRQEVVESRTRSLGPVHPATLEAKSALGVTLYQQEEHSAARKVEKEVLEARHHELNQARVNAAAAACSLARTLAKIDGCLDEAAEMLRGAIHEFRAIIGDEHPETARQVSLLTEMYLESGEPDRAREVVRESLEALEAAHGPDHPATRGAAERLRSINAAEHTGPASRAS